MPLGPVLCLSSLSLVSPWGEKGHFLVEIPTRGMCSKVSNVCVDQAPLGKTWFALREHEAS